ncbi:MAG: hypothetical protein SPE43_07635 [Ruminococcus sp.]|nr:hypothetical protein [Oscillospiraceae bacterium]MDY4414217.1 hypothetical protein [Ruminococcus sp.]
MIKFRILSADFKIDFSFFMFMALIFMTNNYRNIIMFFTACAVHELGHLVAMLFTGAEIKSIFISGLGINIMQSRENLISSGRSLLILSGGITLNLLIFLSGFFCSDFAQINLMLFIFNILPFRNLDGGSIILCIGEILNLEFTAEIILKIFAVIFSVLVFFMIYLYGFSALPAGAVILYYCFSELI